MDKTIKQVADEHGLTKQAVRKHIDKLSSGCYYVGSNKTIFITPKGQKELDSKLKSKVATLPPTDDTNLIATLEKRVLELQEDKKFLKEQLDIKDKQIESYAKAFESLKLITEEKAMAIEVAEEPPKSKWWQIWR